MEWIKAIIKTNAYGAETVTGILMSNGITGMEIIDPQDRVRHLTEISHSWDYVEDSLMDVPSDEAHVVFYVTKDSNGEGMLTRIQECLTELKRESDQANPNSLDSNRLDLGSLELKLESADDKTWLNEWKKYFKPLHIGNVVIVPEWDEYTASHGEVIFTIDPGSAFGTGQHQTTRLCIESLQEFMGRGDTLLDVGCGSGILSIIGLLLGAESVFACDIDPAGAIAATNKNATLNPVDITRLQIHAGDAISDPVLRGRICEVKYDIVVANIVADVIIEILPLVSEVLKPGGFFIASGIISERLEDVLTAFASAKIKVHHVNELEDWHCVIGKHHA